ncbi:MAG: VanZ family protein [Bacteroidota bacterium]
MFAFLTKHRPGYGPAIGWFIISTILLCLPGSRFPKYNWLSDIQFDKWIHVGLFGVLVLLTCWGYWSCIRSERSIYTPFILYTLLAIVYGVGIEFVQEHFIPNRSFDTGDIWADVTGSLAGCWFSIRRFGKK